MSLIYDPVRQRVVMFGGYDGNYQNDVWALSLGGTPGWTRLLPTGIPPSGRMFTLAVYDPPRDRMIVFGGHPTELNDVWALSFATLQWNQILPAGTPPSPRYGHMGVYDPAGDRLIVFGGFDGNAGSSETWALSLSGTPTWTPLALAGPRPSARWYGSAAYDSRRGRMVVHGGFTGTGTHDTWALDLAAAPAWYQLTTGGLTPPDNLLHSAIYQPSADRMVVFDGRAGVLLTALVWGDVTLSPIITGFHPAGGVVGDAVQIFGSALSGATQATFNGVPAVISQSSYSSAETTVPAGASTGPITVTTPGGTATSVTSFFVGERPEVLSATPNTAKIGSTVTIGGHHFTAATSVRFGPASNAAFMVDSDDQITATIDAAATTGPISVTTPAATGTSTFDFTVIPFDNFGRIVSVKDVSGDQGGLVTVRWVRSDFDDDLDHQVTAYRVWRRAPLEGATRAVPASWKREITAAGSIVYWEPMALVPAAFLDGYAYVSPTLQDSTEDSNPYTAFFIQTLTADALTFYNSPVDSGYSVDNKPPKKPPKFESQVVSHRLKLVWGGNEEKDLYGYRLHRGSSMTFTPDSANQVQFNSDTAFVDTLGLTGAYYKLAAVDIHGNVSKYALMTPSGSTTSVAFLVSSQVGPEHVQIDWYVIGLPRAVVNIYRSRDGVVWERRRTAVADQYGFVGYRDDDVHPGERLAYRLGTLDGEVEEFSEQTWVTIPDDRLALLGVSPNPVTNGTSLAVRLLIPRGGDDATLRLVDIAGRVIRERVLRGVASGPHEERLTGGNSPGIYWVQLRLGGQSVATKVVLLR